jgi:hypothetical protein
MVALVGVVVAAVVAGKMLRVRQEVLATVVLVVRD